MIRDTTLFFATLLFCISVMGCATEEEPAAPITAQISSNSTNTNPTDTPIPPTDTPLPPTDVQTITTQKLKEPETFR